MHRALRRAAFPIVVIASVSACAVAPDRTPSPAIVASDDAWSSVWTDVAANVDAVDALLTAGDLGLEGDWSVRKDRLRGGLQDGVERLVVDTGALRIVILPTRGMSVLEVTAGDLRIGWRSPSAAIVHPRQVDLAYRGGLGWLLGFNEWMVRCGLEFAGHPGTDRVVDNVGNESEMELTLHGRIAQIPASRVEVRVDRAPPHRIRILGTVDESHFYGPHLRLSSELSVVPGEAAWRIRDTVTNTGASAQEFELIYHGNYGAPLLEEGAVALVPARRVTPMNATAAAGLEERATYRGPTAGFVEQVFLIEPFADGAGRTAVLLRDATGTRAVRTAWNVAELPYLTQWKNTAAVEDGYVTGLEPGTSYPFPRRIERQAGRVPRLVAGGSRSFTLDFAIFRGADAVAAAAAGIEAIAGGRSTEVVCEPPEVGDR